MLDCQGKDRHSDTGGSYVPSAANSKESSSCYSWTIFSVSLSRTLFFFMSIACWTLSTTSYAFSLSFWSRATRSSKRALIPFFGCTGASSFFSSSSGSPLSFLSLSISFLVYFPMNPWSYPSSSFFYYYDLAGVPGTGSLASCSKLTSSITWAT